MATRVGRAWAVAVAALACCAGRSTYAVTASARSKLNPIQQSRIPLSFSLSRIPKSPAPAPYAAAGVVQAASTEPGGGETKHQLRRALPAFEQDDQLREALAQCEADMLAADAASTEDEAEAAKRSAGLHSRSASSSSCLPLEGLRRFSHDGVDGVFMGAAGVPLRYRLFPKYSEGKEGDGKLQPGVVLLTGLMESMAKYGETIAYLNDSGFSVYTFDHHGQGLSGRLPVPDTADPKVAHINNFDHYVQDLLRFSKVILPAKVKPQRSSIKADGGGDGGTGGGTAAMGEGESISSEGGRRMRLSVVGHSMGGLVAVKAAIQEPLLFDGLVLAAPMFAPNTGKLANGVVGAVAWVATKLGQGYRSPIRRPARATMEWSRVTHDKRRLRLWETLRGRVGCVLQRGPSFAWLSAAVGASKRVRRQLGGLAVPVLVLEAGQDGMVRSDGIEQFRRRAPKTVSVRYRLFEGAYHDLFDETDDIRLEVLRETCWFLSAASTDGSESDQR